MEKFKSLSRERRDEIKCKFGFEGSDNGFIVYIRQEGKGLELMWLLLDPTNPVDPRCIC